MSNDTRTFEFAQDVSEDYELVFSCEARREEFNRWQSLFQLIADGNSLPVRGDARLEHPTAAAACENSQPGRAAARRLAVLSAIKKCRSPVAGAVRLSFLCNEDFWGLHANVREDIACGISWYLAGRVEVRHRDPSAAEDVNEFLHRTEGVTLDSLNVQALPPLESTTLRENPGIYFLSALALSGRTVVTADNSSDSSPAETSVAGFWNRLATTLSISLGELAKAIDAERPLVPTPLALGTTPNAAEASWFEVSADGGERAWLPVSVCGYRVGEDIWLQLYLVDLESLGAPTELGGTLTVVPIDKPDDSRRAHVVFRWAASERRFHDGCVRAVLDGLDVARVNLTWRWDGLDQ